jgi:DnaJ-class molecular chaperone
MSAAKTDNIQKCFDILDEINSESSICFNTEIFNALVEAGKELAALKSAVIANTSTNIGMAAAKPAQICPACDGSGYIGPDGDMVTEQRCTMCKGRGKLRHA